MNAKPRFVVVKLVPSFSDFDGIIGWSIRVLACTMTQGFAHLIQDREDSDGMDETQVQVFDVATGCRVHPELPDFTGELYA